MNLFSGIGFAKFGAVP